MPAYADHMPLKCFLPGNDFFLCFSPHILIARSLCLSFHEFLSMPPTRDGRTCFRRNPGPFKMRDAGLVRLRVLSARLPVGAASPLSDRIGLSHCLMAAEQASFLRLMTPVLGREGGGVSPDQPFFYPSFCLMVWDPGGEGVPYNPGLVGVSAQSQFPRGLT